MFLAAIWSSLFFILQRTICHCRYSDQACECRWFPLLIQSLTRFSSSSRFPLNINPLHFNHRFNWPTVHSCGSPSNLEPGTSSSSVRTVKDGSKPLAIPTFPLQGLTSIAELAFVCLTHDGGLKFRDVISALCYILHTIYDIISHLICIFHVFFKHRYLRN